MKRLRHSIGGGTAAAPHDTLAGVTIAAPPHGAIRDAVPAGRVGSRTALLSILGFWSFYFALTTVRAALMGYDGQLEMLGRRAAVTVVGVGIVLMFYLALRPFDTASLRRRIMAAVALSVPMAALYASANYVAFYLYAPLESATDGGSGATDAFRIILDSTTSWYFFFAAWAALYLALGFAGEVRVAERRAAASAQEAQIAQLRALRYQINPHFLFNTLNSLSTLVLRRRTEEAERMIMNLATFFRTSLTAEPAHDVTLTEELRLQRLYLDIEAVRFPDRLRVAIDVPPEATDACVPALILQPLVENAIKHGVARSRRAVTLSIVARIDGAALVVAVSDDGDGALIAPGAGTGLGLANVRDRLAARFGVRATATWGPAGDAGFTATLRLPVVRHG